jgi:hypothetical protein
LIKLIVISVFLLLLQQGGLGEQLQFTSIVPSSIRSPLEPCAPIT